MAFQNKGLSVIAYANGFTLWHYTHKEDGLSQICETGYFDTVHSLVNNGDIVMINAAGGQTGMRAMEFNADGRVVLKNLQ